MLLAVWAGFADSAAPGLYSLVLFLQLYNCCFVVFQLFLLVAGHYDTAQESIAVESP